MTDNGILTLYALENVAAAGEMPTQKLTEVGAAYYGERTVGYSRLYAAMGADQKIDLLVRCYNIDIPATAGYVVMEDGTQYQITAKQKIVGKDAVDLTLVRVEKYYDVDHNGKTEKD